MNIPNEAVALDVQGEIATLTLSRPEKLNAIDEKTLQGIEQVVSQALPREEPRCLIITGQGKAFAAGADIAAMQKMSVQQARDFSYLGNHVFSMIEQLPYPVIAAVNGFALGGGCELALACDFIYAGQRAKFGQPEVKLGLIPGFGGTIRLRARVGAAAAKELIFSGRTIDAAEALRMGLATCVVADDQLIKEARATAEAISEAAPGAVRTAKEVLYGASSDSFEAAQRLESEAFGRCFECEDRKEGIAAFLEKRKAKFRGR